MFLYIFLHIFKFCYGDMSVEIWDLLRGIYCMELTIEIIATPFLIFGLIIDVVKTIRKRWRIK